jgi:NADPH2:quinone reductase
VACFPNNYPTAWEMLVRKAGIGPDDTVFVWAGTSGLGGAAIDIAQIVGARVLTSAGSAEKRQILAARGLEVFDHSDPGLVDAVLAATDGWGPRIVFEHVGAATWERSLELCAPSGTIVSAGATSGDDARMNITAMFAKQLRILGSRVADMDIALAAARQLDLGRFDPLVGVTLSLDEVAEGHRLLERGAVAGKIVVEFDG